MENNLTQNANQTAMPTGSPVHPNTSPMGTVIPQQRVPIPSVPPQKKREKQVFELKDRDIIFAVLFCITAILFASLALWGGFQIGVTITTLFALVVFTVYLHDKETKIKAYPLVCAILAVVASISFTITSNGSVRFFSFWVVIALSMVWFHSLVNEHPEKEDLGIVRMLWSTVNRGIFINLPKTLVSLFYGQGKYRKLFSGILIGLATAFPILLIVVPLLVSSDAAFAGFVESIIGDIATVIGKLIIGFVVAPFVISYGFTLKKEKALERKKSTFKGLDNTIIITFLSTLSVCYIAYLVSQLAYFFSAFAGFLPEDYTFTMAGYARRGFFEMSVIAAINLVILFAALLLSKKKEDKMCVASRVICTFISVFTLIIIATAFSKMYMYIDNFGLTKMRILTSAFMVFLAIVFVALLLRLYISKVQVLAVALVTAGIVLSVLGIGNVNHVVADYNYKAYISGKLEEIDVENISRQEEEGVPYLIMLAKGKDEEVAAEAKECIYELIMYGDFFEYETLPENYNVKIITGRSYYEAFEEYCVTRHKAYELMEEYLRENPKFEGHIEFRLEME